MTKTAAFRTLQRCLLALSAIAVLIGEPLSFADGTPCPVVVLRSDGSNSAAHRAPNARALFGRSVWLITAAEAASSGLVSGTVPAAIGFHYSVAPGVTATGSLKVYLENTSDTSNTKSSTWASAISGMTLVHNDPATVLPDTTDPFDIPFSGSGVSSFTYTGDGLYVAFDWSWAGPTVNQAVIACTLALPGGIKTAQSNTSAPTTLTVGNTRPETRLTPSVASLINDAGVDFVISMGSAPKTFVGPQTIQAVITNRGVNALSNFPVSLNITGAQAFSDVQTIDTLAACVGRTTVTFAPFTPLVIGSNTVTVSIPSDDDPSNNTGSEPLDVTDTLYSYLHPGTEPDDFAFTNQPSAVVAKFPITAAAKISEVHLHFKQVSAGTYRVVIFPDSGSGTPGSVPLYQDAVDRSVLAAGPVTIALPTPIDVGPGSFFVGFAQTNNVEFDFSIDYENPLRPETFFGSIPYPPADWFTFEPNNPFTLVVGVTLAQCSGSAECNDGNPCTDDACTNSVCLHTNNSAACDDGNACTQTDACQSGLCTGSNPVVCTASDQCHDAGTCVPETGFCSNPSKPDATSCNDGNACTTQDGCSNGSCVGSSVSCDDGNPCTADGCVDGVCVSTPIVCPEADVWVGLTNSDDVGIKFDLRAEIYRTPAGGGSRVLVSSGNVASVPGGGAGFNNARLDVIPLQQPTAFESGDQIDFVLSVRNACVGSGKNSGRARLWFNDPAANSRLTVDASRTYYLRMSGTSLGLETNVGAGPKKTIDIQAGAKCSAYVPFGTWSRTVQ